MKVRSAENMEEKEIEQIVDKKFQEIIAEGVMDHEITTTTEIRKAIMGMKNKKSHICEKGGAHLRISFWYLLMNLKNK